MSRWLIAFTVVAVLVLAFVAGTLARSAIDRPAAAPHAIVVQSWDDNYTQDGGFSTFNQADPGYQAYKFGEQNPLYTGLSSGWTPDSGFASYRAGERADSNGGRLTVMRVIP